MKRKLSIFFIALILVFGVVLAACTDAELEQPSEPTDPVNPPAEETIFTVTVDNGAEVVELKKKSGETVTVTAAELEYKLFLGWEYEGERVSAEETYLFAVDRDAALNAVYCDAYTLYLDAGSGEVSAEAVTVGAGMAFTLPVPVLIHHVFLGWFDGVRQYTDENGASLESFSTGADVVLKAKYREKPVYEITVNNGDGATSETIAYHEGELVTLEAAPVQDKRCVGWSDGTVTVTTDNTYSFTVNGNAEYTAVYEFAFMVTVIEGTGSGTYNLGQSVTVRVQTSSPGRRFIGWREIGTTEILSTESVFTFEVTRSISLEACFEKILYNLTYYVNGEQWGKAERLYYGDPIALRAFTPEEHYVFSGWSQTPNKMPASDVDVRGTTAKETHRLNVIGGVGGGVFEYGTSVTVTATVATGKAFSHWTENGVKVSEDAEYTFVLEHNRTLTAHFTDIIYKFTYYLYGAEFGAEGGVYRSYDLIYGAPVPLEEPPRREHHTFSGWSMTPAAMPARDYTVEGTFSIHRHTFTVNNGYINGDSGLTKSVFDWNEEVTVTPVIPRGMIFESWTSGERTVSQDAEYTFRMPGENNGEEYELTANFLWKEYFITYYVDGEPYGEPVMRYFESEIVPAAYPVREHYNFSGWSCGGGALPATMPDRDLRFDGYFTLVKHSLTVIDGYIGEDTGLTRADYDYGTTVTVTAVPPVGEAFREWRDRNSRPVAGAGEVYTFVLTEDTLLDAAFSSITYYARYYTRILPDGAYEPHDTRTFNYNQPFTPVAEPPKAHYSFGGWRLEGGGRLPSLTPAADLNIYGEYTIDRHTVGVRNGYFTGYERDITEITVDYGTPVTVEAIIPVGKDFARWTADGENVSASASYAFTVSGNITLTAGFVTSRYRVTVTGGKIISVDGNAASVVSAVYDYGTELKVRADKPEAGYRFSHWLLNDDNVSPQAEYTFTLTSASSLQAVNVNVEYSITYYVSGAGCDGAVPFAFNDGRVNPIVGEQVVIGYRIDLYDAPAAIPHYHFGGWKYAGGNAVPSVIVVMDYDIAIHGEYILDTHTLSVTGGSGGGVYDYGSTVTATAEPPTGKSFVRWTDGNGAEVSRDAEFTFVLEEDTALTAEYEDILYTVSYKLVGAGYGEEGQVVETVGDLIYGEALPAAPEAAPIKDYVFGGWSYDGGEPPAVMPASDITITGRYIHLFIYEENADGYTVSANPEVAEQFPSSVTLPSVFGEKPVTAVKADGFASVRGVSTLTVPDSVTEIGKGAFPSRSLTELTLPVLSGGCLGYYFGADSAEEQPSVVPNTLITVNYTGTLVPEKAFAGLTHLTTVTFDKATAVGASALEGCTSLAALTVPSSVTEIGAYAFRNLRSLETVNFDAVRCADVTEGLFYNSGTISGAITVTIGGSVEDIPANLFYSGATGGMYARVTKVVFESGALRSVGSSAFRGLRNLVAEIKLPVGLERIGENAFYGAAAEILTVPYTVTALGASAFGSMSSLTAIDFYAEAASGADAFAGSGNAAALSIGANVRNIPERLFASAKIATVVFASTGAAAECGADYSSSSLEAVGARAFYSSDIARVQLPAGLLSVGEYAFASCRGLTEAAIPARLNYLGDGAFSSCPALTEILYDARILHDFVASSDVFASSGGDSGITVTVGASVEYVPAYAFYCADNNFNLAALVFADGSVCVEIGEYAFAYASNLTSMEIGEEVKTIGAYAFAETGASSVVLPYRSYFIGEKAFYYSASLNISCEVAAERTGIWASDWAEGVAGVTYGYGNTADADFDYVISGDKVYLTAYRGGAEAVVPETVAGKPVAGVGSVFSNNTAIVSVSLPSGVTEIIDYAFRGCTSLESVSATEIGYIGDYAFADCVGLTTADFTFIGKEIGNYAFSGCNKLASFDLSSVEAVGEYAFAGSGLTSAELTVVVAIGRNAFSGTELIELVLPASLKYIREDAFADCALLVSLSADESNARYETADGVLFERSSRLLMYYPAGSERTHYEIPEGTLSVGKYAFLKASKLNTLALPASLEYIGEKAFMLCSGLVSVTYDPVSCIEAGADAFLNAGEETEGITLTIGALAESIPAGLFDTECKLTSVIFETTVLAFIGENAFRNNSFTELMIPSSVTEIGAGAFDGKGLTALNYNAVSVADFAENAAVFTMAEGAEVSIGAAVARIPANFLYGGTAANLTSVLNFAPSSVSLEIGENAFRDTALLRVTLDARITEIGDYAFAGIAPLANVVVEFTADVGGRNIFDDSGLNMAAEINSENVSDELFNAQNTPHIIELTLTGTVRAGINSFKNLSLVTELILPESLRTIGAGAFENMSGLTRLTVPAGVTSIGAGAFRGTDGLTEINYNAVAAGDFEVNGGVFATAGVTSADLTVNIGGAVEFIPSYLFAPEEETAYGRIKRVTFASPSALETVGSFAFAHLASAVFFPIPANVRTIGRRAFYGCELITEAALGSVVAIEEGAFASTGLTSFSAVGGSGFNLGDNAFADCSALASVSLGGYIETIGSGAFAGCSALADMTSLPDDLRHIGSGAFAGCTELVAINLGSVIIEILKETFSGCAKLAGVEIPATVVAVGKNAFRGCASLTEITLPSALLKIESGAFYGCKGLTSIAYNAENCNTGFPLDRTSEVFADAGASAGGITLSVGSRVRVIPDYLFYNSVMMSDGGEVLVSAPKITSINYAARSGDISAIGLVIGDYAFSGLPLGVVALPDFVTSVGDYAFAGCSSAVSLTWGEGLNIVGNRAFAEMRAVRDFYHYAAGLSDTNFVSINDTLDINCDVFYDFGVSGGVTLHLGAEITKIHKEMFTIYTSTEYSLSPRIAYIEFEQGSRFNEIQYNAFRLNPHLVRFISPPSNPMIIGERAFYGCGITDASFMADAREIGQEAFFGCSSLTGITLGRNLVKLGTEAFKDCVSVEAILIDVDRVKMPAVHADGFINVGTAGAGAEVIVASAVGEVPGNLFRVSESGSGPNIAKVTFEGIQSPGYKVSDNKYNLELGHADPTALSIGDYAFTDIDAEFVFNDPIRYIKSVGTGAFENCSGISVIYLSGKEYELTGNVMEPIHGEATIGAGAFRNSSVSSVEVLLWIIDGGDLGPETRSQIRIGSESFRNSGLTSFGNITYTTEIGARAFEGCTSFTGSISLEGAERIGNDAFKNTALSEVYIGGKTLQSIGAGAFASCPAAIKADIVKEDGQYFALHKVFQDEQYQKDPLVYKRRITVGTGWVDDEEAVEFWVYEEGVPIEIVGEAQ